MRKKMLQCFVKFNVYFFINYKENICDLVLYNAELKFNTSYLYLVTLAIEHVCQQI